MAVSCPKKLLASVDKACRQPWAIECAISLQGFGDQAGGECAGDTDVPSRHLCTLCDYVAASRNALTMHMVSARHEIQEISRCVGSSTCAVGGLLFSGISSSREHLSKSAVCRKNILSRGAFLLDAEIRAINIDNADSKQSNCSKGLPKFKGAMCVRTFGPHKIVYDLDDRPLEPYRGNPLGKTNGGRLFLPIQLLEVVDSALMVPADACPASFRAPCTDFCLLCRRDDEDVLVSSLC